MRFGVLVTFAVAVAGLLLPAGRALAEDSFLLCDFEAETMSTDLVVAAESWIERVEVDEGGHALRWIHEPIEGKRGGWLDFPCVPSSVRAFHAVRFRARCVGSWNGRVDVRFSSRDGYIGSPLPAVGPQWATYELTLATMKGRRAFDPDAVGFLRFVCWETTGFELELDDIELLRGEGGWGRSEGQTAPASTQNPDTPCWIVADFEGEDPLSRLAAARGELTLVEPKRRKETRAGRWTAPASKDTVWINLEEMPPTLEPYRLLRFRARAPKGFAEEVYVRFRSGDAHLSTRMPALSPKGKWTDVEIELPRMGRDGEAAPDAGYVMRFVVFGTEGFEFEFDDVELVRGAGGWALTEDEHLASVFGAKRRKKVKEIETEHFRIYTDSAGARTKFPRALEKTYAFVLDALGLDEMKEPLDVFIFQNSNYYFDFCVRKGWTQAQAEATAGHAWSRYFATYYQAPSSPTVTHELTHSIVHRVWGSGGGSWFQEGTAVCVEERWQKRDAATRFAPRLRAGDYVPLAEFMCERKLIHGHDVRGGAHSAHALYDQAGAFFEFLLRGPYAEMRPEAIRQLARVDWDADTIVQEVEAIYGTTLLELETAWKEWGSEPPELD